ncbi:a81a2be6-a8e7-4f56-89c4-6571f13111e2 [Thermothielavioides terrestris]|uniref:RING-type E3 ubiquitin transferase n=1 Tax=Thermothielavioides terrestris TaxID=2587410 RepID=A0A446BQM0_9PEZI|nr:a81a2be6-a8e7-4f56-89c4-6571f13111e2 [Thermothielavioides terrestris]
MDTGARSDDTDDANDIHAQVLRTTLGEIETSQRESEDGTADSRDCCVICLDSISDACAALPCGHAHFDFLCLLSWLQQHPNCPLCKANVYKVRYADAQQAEAIYRVPNAARPRGGMRDERTGDARRQSPLDSAFRRRFTSQNGLLRETGSRRPRTPPSPNEALERRRYVYRHQLYSLHIGSNRTSQYRPPPTPVQFSSTPHLVSRARMWIRRELQVFPFLCSPDPDPIPTGLSIEEARHRQRLRNNAEFLLEYIIAILKTVDLQDSAGQAEAMLADFLGRDNVRLFLHELRSWLRSPAPTLAAWDREKQQQKQNSDGVYW